MFPSSRFLCELRLISEFLAVLLHFTSPAGERWSQRQAINLDSS